LIGKEKDRGEEEDQKREGGQGGGKEGDLRKIKERVNIRHREIAKPL
jgi:hypothetical protein